ncbi:DCC1-like thiol-disulfide oxidoreductase family protein [Falsibacillus pallidus]|uniref:DCC1-like thiol-disulfide oxidoreductase family protein n=1 Tax=Falsibacillus pallidus TaxID=493781 RepID=UPI003D962F1B
MVTAKGEVLAGFQTVRKILTLLPVIFPISWIFYLPFMKKLLSPVYMWVSTNRYDWFGRYDVPHTS